MMYIIAISLAFIILITVVVNSLSVRANETEDSLRVALDQAITSLDYSKIQFTTKDELEDELIKNLITSISVQIDSESQLSIEILNCDIEKGVIDINVTETYTVFSKQKTVSVQRTVLIDQITKEDRLNRQIYFGLLYNNSLYTIDTFSIEFPDGSVCVDGVIPANSIIDFDSLCLGFTDSEDVLHYYKSGQPVGEPGNDDTVLYIRAFTLEQMGITDMSLLTLSPGWYEYQGASSEKLSGEYIIDQDVIFVAT